MSKICPYCGKQMKTGYIYHGSQDLVWTPENSNPSSLINFPHEDQIMISKFTWWKIEKVKTYWCPDCHMMILFKDDQ